MKDGNHCGGTGNVPLPRPLPLPRPRPRPRCCCCFWLLAVELSCVGGGSTEVDLLILLDAAFDDKLSGELCLTIGVEGGVKPGGPNRLRSLRMSSYFSESLFEFFLV